LTRKLKILISSLNFSPELTGIGKYSGEMAHWLAARGHDVRVITAPPYYPDWKVWDGYSARSFRREESFGVRVYRCPLWVPRRVSGVKRIVHLATYAMSNLAAMLSQWGWRPDVVWVAQPALFSAPAALLLARLTGARSWLHVQDYEVDAAFEMGLLRGERIRAMVSAGERALIRGFDVVSSISGRMVDRAQAKGIALERLEFFPNWVDLAHIRPLNTASPYRASLGIPPDAVVALYSGNMGAKQGLEILAAAARSLLHDQRVCFVFCGDGAGKEQLACACEGLPNVRLLPLQPKEQLNDLLGLADIHLLPQRADAADLVLPSKLTGMLASGRPVVVTAAPQTELGQVVRNSDCGVLVPPEDPAAFADAIRTLAGDPDARARMGAAARRYAESKLDSDAVLAAFERRMLALSPGP
jgi:colanic acid biosynthesis glycosyl transferase WcaI